MTVNLVRLSDCPFVPWKNGGGRTRELLAWPSRDDWWLRVSVAEIEADGPFSAFPGVDRCFAVLEGHGVRLALPDGERRAGRGDAIAFAGEDALMCHLIDGPTRDLNLMVRRHAGTPRLQREPIATGRWRALYADATLWWTEAPGEALPPTAGWHLALQA